MRLSKLFIPLAVAGLLFSSCKQQAEIAIQIPDRIVGETDTHLYFVDVSTGETIDSLAIPADVEGSDVRTVTYMYKSEPLRQLKAVAGDYSVVFFTERGRLSADMDSSFCATGSVLNDEYLRITETSRERRKKMLQDIEQHSNDDMTDDELEVVYEKALAEYKTDLKPIYTEHIEEHLNDVLGAALLYQATDILDVKEVEDLLARGGENLRSYGPIKAWAAKNKALEETSEGHNYVDIIGLSQAGNGPEVKLSEWVREGNYTIIDFWASWCSPCRKEVPKLQALWKKYQTKGLGIFGVAISDKPADTQAAMSQLKIEWPVMNERKQGEIAETYGITGIPTLLLLDPSGKIVYRGHDSEGIDQYLSEFYSQKAK